MTIDELIEKLAQYPGDYEVVMHCPTFEDEEGAITNAISTIMPGNYNPDKWHPFTYNGNGKYVDVNAVVLEGEL